jgi:hypothetical protein
MREEDAILPTLAMTAVEEARKEPMPGRSPEPGRIPGFWRRQFDPSATTAQRWFDLCVGIIAPLLCAFFDPAVFRSNGIFGGGILNQVRLFGYLEIAMGVAALAYYLVARRASLSLAGVLYAGALFSFLVGLAILPFSILGMFVLIGVFGLTPFFSSFVYLRNGYRCWRELSQHSTRQASFLVVGVAFILTLGMPLALQISASRMANRALVVLQSGSEEDSVRALQTLERMRFAANPDDIVLAYQKTKDEKQRARLAQAFQMLAGRNIEERLVELND